MTEPARIAALFVETNGVYFGLPNVDPWDQARDARLYDGPHPVVAHGHRARKATWLYAHGVDLPSLKWGTSGKRERLHEGFHSKEERRRAVRTGICQRLSKRQRAATPIEFRNLLISMVTA